MKKKFEFVTYRKDLTEKARYLRKHSTKGEIKLWQYLKRDQLGVDFHRQKPMLSFIADFYCAELKLVIEIDGYTHLFEDVKLRDKRKDKKLNEIGITVLRIDGNVIWFEIDTAIILIQMKIEELKATLQDTSL